MEDTVKKQAPHRGSMTLGIVKFTEDAFYWVETPAGLFKAKISASCLLEPRASDSVLLWENPCHTSYILSILERADASPAALVFDGGVDFKVKNGELGFLAEGIHITGKEIALNSKELNIHALKGRANIGDFSFLGRFLDARIQKIRSVAATCDLVAESVSQRVKRCYRWVSEIEQSKVGRLTCIVKDSLFIKGKRSFFMAEKKVTVDAEKIHLG